MSMNRLLLMMGLPRSGKSTIAKKLDFPIVNPDAIRLALHGEPFIPEAEPMVWAVAQYMVRALFIAGHTTVIIDATNTTVKRRAMWISKMWETMYFPVDTAKEECLLRARESNRFDLVEVIDRMFQQFEPVDEEAEGLKKW